MANEQVSKHPSIQTLVSITLPVQNLPFLKWPPMHPLQGWIIKQFNQMRRRERLWRFQYYAGPLNLCADLTASELDDG